MYYIRFIPSVKVPEELILYNISSFWNFCYGGTSVTIVSAQQATLELYRISTHLILLALFIEYCLLGNKITYDYF